LVNLSKSFLSWILSFTVAILRTWVHLICYTHNASGSHLYKLYVALNLEQNSYVITVSFTGATKAATMYYLVELSHVCYKHRLPVVYTG
jgi:hypothetical protein